MLPPDAGAPAPPCSAGLLGPVLALVTGVLGGATPAQALAAAGAVPAEPAPAGSAPVEPAPGAPILAGPAPFALRSAPAPAPAAAVLPGSPGDVPMLLPIDGRWVRVAGLAPLLDAVAHREGARTAAGLPPLASPAVAPHAAGPVPTAGVPAAGPGARLEELGGLLGPLGVGLDPSNGLLDPLLAPVLGSLGCAPAVPGAAVAAPAVPGAAPAGLPEAGR